METYIKQPARKKYKKAYREKSLPVYPTYQSQQIEVRGQRFIMVGQYLLPHSPILSRFDLFDQEIKSVDHEVGKEAYEIFARLQLIPSLQKLITPLEVQQGMEIEQVQNELNEMFVGQGDLVNIISTLRQLSDYAEAVSKKPFLEENDHEQFQEKWNAFWALYEERCSFLRRMFPQFVEKKNSFQQATENEQRLFTALLEEGWILNQIFTCLAPSHETGFNTIDEVIDWSYKLGRINPGAKLDVSLSMFERISYKMLKLVMLFSYWVVLPFMFLVFVIAEFMFEVLLFPAMILFVYRPIYKQYIKRLQVQKSSKVDRINQEIIKAGEFDPSGWNDQPASIDLKKSKEQQQKSKELYSVKGAYLNRSLVMFYIGIASLVVLIGFWYMYGWSGIETKVMFFVTIITVTLGLFLPYTKLAVQTVKLLEDGLLIGKYRVNSNLIKEVMWEEKSGHIIIKHHDLDVSSEFIVKKVDRKQMTEALRKWIEIANIPYREDSMQ